MNQSSGMTMVEAMVAAGVGSILAMVLAMVFMTSSRSFFVVANYATMENCSRNALSQMTRNIRNAKSLTSFGPVQLVFNYDGAGKTLTYRYDTVAHTLTEEWPSTTKTLLTGVDSLNFSMYDRNMAGTSVLTNGKVISVTWKCSRSILGRKLTTEDMQQAKIVIRNQS